MNKAVYGNSMENMGKIVKIRIVKNEKDIIKYTSKPTCDRWNNYDKKLVVIGEKKIWLTLNKPTYVGFTVWESSKWELHNFQYNFMIRKCNTRLFTDTDCLCYEIHGKKHTQKFIHTKTYLI